MKYQLYTNNVTNGNKTPCPTSNVSLKHFNSYRLPIIPLEMFSIGTDIISYAFVFIL